MKHRHALMLLAVTLPICIFLRAIQMFFTIDFTTGFIKQQYSAISVLITVIICAAIASIGLIAATLDGKINVIKGPRPVMTLVCTLAGGMFIYQTVAGLSAIASGAWYDVLLLLLTLMSAFVFVAYGFKNMYEYDMQKIIFVIPVVYYVIRLISVFVSTAKLALVTENVFLVFTDSVLLWFMLEFASFENEIGETQKRPKRLFASGIAASMLCSVTSIPKLMLASLSKLQLSSADISAALLDLSVGIFILVYIVSNFGDASEKQKHVSKHSA